MTYQQIIEQAEKLSPDEQQSLLSFLFTSLNKDKKKGFSNLFYFKDESENSTEKPGKKKLLNLFADWKGKLPSDLIINDDEFYD